MATNDDRSPSRQNRNVEESCAVCGDRPAFNSFGGLSCSSCKMFFRRNESYDLSQNRCRLNGDCVINVENRRSCRYCRLKKCFDVGMQRELFRSAHGFNEVNRPQTTETNASVNFLEQDRSALTTEDWALITRTVNSYDSTSPINDIRQQIETYSKYPSKMRLKIISSHYLNFVAEFYRTAMRFIMDNNYFNQFSSRDRRIILKRNLITVGNLHQAFILRELRIDQHYEYNHCANEIYGSSIIRRMTELSSTIIQDSSLMKMFMAMCIFSTNFTDVLVDDRQQHNFYSNADFCDTKRLLTIENLYTEVIFKYMLFRYGYVETSSRFLALIRIVIELNRCLAAAQQIDSHRTMIQEIFDSIDRNLSDQEDNL